MEQFYIGNFTTFREVVEVLRENQVFCTATVQRYRIVNTKWLLIMKSIDFSSQFLVLIMNDHNYTIRPIIVEKAEKKEYLRCCKPYGKMVTNCVSDNLKTSLKGGYK